MNNLELLGDQSDLIHINQVSITRDFHGGLEPFWTKWGDQMSQVTMYMPDFQNPDWWRQIYPPDWPQSSDVDMLKVREQPVITSYYKIEAKSDSHQYAALQELVTAALDNNYDIIVEVDPWTALSPLGYAGKYNNTVVIGLDAGKGPYPKYPHIYRPDRIEWFENYPFAADEINRGNFRNSGAFYFPLDATERSVLDILNEKASRVQIIAPNPADGWGESLVFKVIEVAPIVSVDGDLVLIGEGRIIRGDNIEEWFTDKLQLSKSRDSLRRLFNSFEKVRYYNLSSTILRRIWGLDSFWVALDPRVAHKQYFIDTTDEPGVLMLMRRKPTE